MSTTYLDKPKNPQRRVFQWWLLVIGFWVGVVVAVIVIGSRPQPTQATYQGGQMSDDAIWMTATALINEATATANAPLLVPDNQVIDPFQLTATAFIVEATQMAGSP